MRGICIFLCIALVGLVFCVSEGHCDSLKDRMLARLPAINALKAQGLVGENNQGLLEFRTAAKPQADVVQAENQDRTTVYGAIAVRQNATAEFVGQSRAVQIAGNEPSGVWIQDAGGAWRRK